MNELLEKSKLLDSDLKNNVSLLNKHPMFLFLYLIFIIIYDFYLTSFITCKRENFINEGHVLNY